MNKDEYKDKYIAIVKAIQKAREEYPKDYTRIYLTRKYGLDNISPPDAEKIITSLKNEGLIEIISSPKISELVDNYTSQEHPASVGQPLHDIYPRPVFPMNYWQVDTTDKFNNMVISHGSPLFLLSAIPAGKKYKDIRKIAILLIEKGEVENYKLAMSFKMDKYDKRKLTKKDYFRNSESKIEYNSKIENRLKSLKKLFKPHNYVIKFNKNMTRLIKK